MDKRLAAIDIGTNSIRAMVVESFNNGEYRILDDEKATIRLGEGLCASGEISDSAWNRAIEALKRMKQIAFGLGVEHIEAVATSAVRTAKNGALFVEEVQREIGIHIEVIDGRQEAELVALSAHRNFSLRETSFAMADIGGGSVEIILARNEHIEKTSSLELGAVFLTEQFLHADPPIKQEIKELRKHIRKTLKQAFPERYSVQFLIGSGGSFTAVGRILMSYRQENFDSVNRYEILHSEIVHLISMIQRKTVNERRMVRGLSPDRADIILAGCVLIDEIMRHLGANSIKINELGIREGMILRALEKYGLTSIETENWQRSIEKMMDSCRVDIRHARQVAAFSKKLLSVLAERYSLTERDSQLLEAASLLHDIGYFINYAKHHKHSYHLIRHARLFDFSPREKEIIANIARYHRKALPKKSHLAYNALSGKDQLLVRQLAGILRLSDGLDRRRNSAVQSLSCSLEKQSITICLVGSKNLSVEVFGGREKSELLETAFALEVIIISNTLS